MLTIHYRPLDALRPLHLAVLVALESRHGLSEAANTLPLPLREMECAAEELEAWAFIARARGGVQATERGRRCVKAWYDTRGKRVWSFAEHPGWVLGTGCFYFARPLASLEEAGWDPETAEHLCEEEALERIEEDREQTRFREEGLGGPARIQLLRQQIQAGDDLEEAWGAFFAGVQTVQEIRTLEPQAREVLDGQCARAGADKAESSLVRFLKRTRWQLWQRHKHLHAAREVLLASWLARQRGVLGRIARAEPDLVKIACEGPDAGAQREDGFWEEPWAA
jgi:hypothetical protein